ncbi:MAG: AMP-binding protein [Burkholderiaceae bacterium]|nr:AMP-binding protein [Burkholderiales bacterium]MCZ8338498.1 AMP-binding protein [Burkholderiaceae bacterium]
MSLPPPPDPLAANAVALADKVAVVDDRPDGTLVRWTFSELNAQANRLAHALAALGVKRGERVVWCGQNSPGVVRMVHAARKLGAVAVPLNYRLTAEEAQYVVDDSDAVLAYVDAEMAPLFREIRPRIPKVREVLVYGGAPLDGQRDVEPLAAAASDAEPPPAPPGTVTPQAMIYTSGTTGRPKGAVRNPPDRAQQAALLEHIGYAPDDVYITTGPLYHSGPGSFMSIAHTLGNTVVLQRKFDAEDWLRLIDRYRATTTFGAPAPVRMACALPASVKARYDRSSMKRFIANAAPWSFALKQAYLADFPADSLFEVYGSTELGVNTVLRPDDQLRKPGACGRPAPMVEIRLYDDEGREVTEPGVPGELAVRAPSVFAAYHNARAKFEEDRRGDFQTVGDVAYFDDEGYFYICDRKKDMIISGGVNVYPAEIEAVIDAHPDVHDVAVIGVPSDEWGESVHAIVVPHAGRTLDEASVVAFARGHLAGFKVPRSVSFAAEIPRNASGKILKKVLREPFWAGRRQKV